MSDFRAYKRKWREHKIRHSIFFPLLLVAIGGFLLLNNLGYVKGDPWQMLVSLWPLLLIVGGLDGLFMGSGFVGSMLFIGIGTIFLLGNLGYNGIDLWSLARFWPVILIAWGLDIVIGKRSIFSAIFGVLVGGALIWGLLWLVQNQSSFGQTARVESIVQSLEGAKKAEVALNCGVGNVQVDSGAEATTLLFGKLNLAHGEMVQREYAVRSGEGYFSLEHYGHANVWLPSTHSQWLLNLNSTLPLTLISKLGAGEQNLDLYRVNIDKLTVQQGVGKMTISLPDKGNFRGEVKLAVGELVIQVHKGTHMRLTTDTAITAIEAPEEFHQYDDMITSPGAEKADSLIDLSIDQPIGSIRVEMIED